MTRWTEPFSTVGRLCLDFGISGGPGVARRYERLETPEDLARWLAWSPLRVAGARATAADLADADKLRPAIFWAASAAAHDEPVPGEHAATLERFARRAPLVPRLGGGYRDPTAHAALSDVARDAIVLLSEPAQRARLRECAADTCPLVFYDDSPANRRRWCSPVRCGDRERARAHRARKAAA